MADDLHPDDEAELELSLAARAYFDEFIKSSYTGLDGTQIERLRKAYCRDVIRWSPIAAWEIAKWYFKEKRVAD